MSRRWYAVQTRVRAENVAALHMCNQGFNVYIPRIRKRRRHARRTEIVSAPLFPGYLFVALDLEKSRWRAINGTVGVVSLVGFGGQPAALPPGVIDSIRECEDENGVVELLPPDLAIGDRVQVSEGAFAEYTGLLVEMSGEQRVVLLLDLLGRQVRVSTPAQALAAVV